MENVRIFHSSVYQGIRNVTSLEKFAYVPNEWSLLKLHLFKCTTSSNCYFDKFEIDVTLLCIYYSIFLISVRQKSISLEEKWIRSWKILKRKIWMTFQRIAVFFDKYGNYNLDPVSKFQILVVKVTFSVEDTGNLKYSIVGLFWLNLYN